MTPGQIAILVVGCVFTLAQSVTLFVLRDFRERIMRIESMLMKERHHAAD